MYEQTHFWGIPLRFERSRFIFLLRFLSIVMWVFIGLHLTGFKPLQTTWPALVGAYVGSLLIAIGIDFRRGAKQFAITLGLSLAVLAVVLACMPA